MKDNRKSGYPDNWFLESFGGAFAGIYSYKNDTAKEEVAAVLGYAGLPEYIEGGPAIRVLDLGCGWGRHALEFASRGYDVTGIDTSKVLLELGQESAGGAGLNVTFLPGDMRSFSLPYSVRLAVNLWTSFGYFSTDAENQAVLKNVFDALEPGGIFILDLDNLPYFLSTTGKRMVSVSSKDGEPVETLKEETYEAGRSRRVVRYRLLYPDRGAEPEVLYLECRLYQYEDIKELLVGAGFEVDPAQKWGDFHGGPLTDKSPRMIVRADKPPK